jgi:DNA invertase Pin-like site-specific DNA recombinase
MELERKAMKPKTAAVYVRVSTSDQNTGLQETELREYCEHRGWQCRVYRDAGQSGAKDNRPALIEMMNDIRRRKIDVIVKDCGHERESFLRSCHF